MYRHFISLVDKNNGFSQREIIEKYSTRGLPVNQKQFNDFAQDMHSAFADDFQGIYLATYYNGTLDSDYYDGLDPVLNTRAIDYFHNQINKNVYKYGNNIDAQKGPYIVPINELWDLQDRVIVVVPIEEMDSPDEERVIQGVLVLVSKQRMKIAAFNEENLKNLTTLADALAKKQSVLLFRSMREFFPVGDPTKIEVETVGSSR